MMHVDPNWQPVFRELGIDADAVFTHPLIKPWRALEDRENCLLDAELVDGRRVRMHVKRYRRPDPTQQESHAFQLLQHRRIPTATLIAWGRLSDGRSFVIAEDLSGYQDAEKLIAAGRVRFDHLLQPAADLAAKLHDAELHHRDLYLCHFFVKVDEPIDVKLIDVARVRQLPRLFAQRWVIKDLAQFWYSTLPLPITDDQRRAWLVRYAQQRRIDDVDSLRRSVERKARVIARHDRNLRQRQPNRNISIPGAPS